VVKLNLGAGGTELPGHIVIDRNMGQEVYPLEYENGSVDEIYASHILEHFGHGQVFDVLKHWVSKLKTGGLIRIAVPDYHLISERYLQGERFNVNGYMMGGQVDENDYHKSLFDHKTLTQLMEQAGLKDISEWKSEIEDAAALSISLNLQGTKKDEVKEESRKAKLAAVMSMSRLCFTANMFSAMRAFLPFGVDLHRFEGVFWGQGLTRLIENHLNDGTDFVFTVDYDTWFTREHVKKLGQLMADNPNVDAMFPVQTGRNNDLPLAGMRDENGNPRTKVNVSEFQKPLTPMDTGHFGLTIFRVSAFKRLKKPWFLPIPDPTGGWGKGRKDEDIYFWNNFNASGCKVCMANEVSVGHLQQLCTFPGLPEDNWKPTHMYLDKLEGEGSIGPPIHCIPKI